MLKDIAESRRINANILEQLLRKDVRQIGESGFEVGAHSLKSLVLSEQFWPKLKDEKIDMPDELKLIQEKYVESFEAFKGNRTLIWKNNLGQVCILLRFFIQAHAILTSRAPRSTWRSS
jgi:anaphase-promoting complex subunit 2